MVGQAIKAGVVPGEITAAFNESSALREQLKKLSDLDSYYFKN